MATGRNVVTIFSLSYKQKSLTCALCLDVFRNPKLLPCSHTFCQRCLEDLIQRHTDGSFPCPSCHKDIEVPAGGASAFQTNFFIDKDELGKAKEETVCVVHQRKTFDLFCVKCDILICMDCSLEEHHHHETQTLAEAADMATTQLVKDKARLQEAKAELEKNVARRTTDQQEFKEKKAVVEREICQRHSTLIAALEREICQRPSTLVAAADEYRDKALAALEASFDEKKNLRSKELVDIHSNTDEIRKLQAMIDIAETKGKSCKIVTVAREMRSGTGSPAAVEKLISIPHLTEVTRPVHCSVVPEDNNTMFDSMENFIGGTEYVEMKFTEPEVKAEEQFRCVDVDNDITLFSVCPKDEDNILVSFDPLYGKTLRPKNMSKTGQFVGFFSHEETCGKVSMKVHKQGHIIYITQSDDRTALYAKLHAEQMYRLYLGQIQVQEIVGDEPFKTRQLKQFAITNEALRAFDVDSSENRFAVVTETKDPAVNRQVKLYLRPDKPSLHRVGAEDIYTSPITPFQPADVCFFTLRGREVLLIADECNDAIHVVDVQDDLLTFSRFLAPGCPLLLQPTALNTDHRGRLWVGCRGGRLVTLEPLSTAAATHGAQH